MALAVLPMVELVKVAEGVRERHDHLGTILNLFIFEKKNMNMCQSVFHCHKWYSPWLNLMRSLRMSANILITLYPAGTVLNQLVLEK